MQNDPNPFDADVSKAASETEEQLAGDEAALIQLTWDQLKKMLPGPLDQKQLTDLMNIVQAATDENEKVASLIQNIDSLGGVVVKILSQVR